MVGLLLRLTIDLPCALLELGYEFQKHSNVSVYNVVLLKAARW